MTLPNHGTHALRVYVKAASQVKRALKPGSKKVAFALLEPRALPPVPARMRRLLHSPSTAAVSSAVYILLYTKYYNIHVYPCQKRARATGLF